MGAAFKIQSEGDFIAQVSAVMEKITGVQLGKKQEAMVRSRILKRALELKLTNILEYAEHFFENEEEEKKVLVSLLTTHHTFFFREFQHFEYLERELLPLLIPEVRKRPDKTLRVWSAACSRGQEVYSLAMFLNIVMPRLAPDLKFQVHGSDVDPESVKIAQNGVYFQAEIREAPLLYLGKHWAKGSGDISDYVKAKSSLKDFCSFSTLNLFGGQGDFPKDAFDVIFCRNVFIYFTPEQITEIMLKFAKCLSPIGHIFLGVSETINGLKLTFEGVGPSVYRLPRPKVAPAPATTAATATPSKPIAPAVEVRKTIRVFSIDDSSTIHTLLKQILLKTPGDFEIVGSAINGVDAAKKLDKKKVDIVTLDIHMPEMNGIDYLKKHFGKDHPPVVMISSVSRDDSNLAYQALELGASDYVEKPALANLEERGDEIRAKLKAAYHAKAYGVQTSLALDKDLSKLPKIKDANACACLVVGTLSQKKQWEAFLKEWGKNAPPVYFFVEGGGAALDAVAKKLSAKYPTKFWDKSQAPLKAGEVGICEFKGNFPFVVKEAGYKKLAINAFTGLSKNAVDGILQNSGHQLFVEDLGKTLHPLKEAASDYVPATSFGYLSWKALGEG